MTDDQRHDMLEIVKERHELRSTLATRQVSVEKWRALHRLDEAIPLDNESACQIACMAIEAYRREEISRGKLLEISAML